MAFRARHVLSQEEARDATACTRVVWVKPGVTEQEFRVDSYACEKDMRQSGYFGTGISGAIEP